MKAIIIYCICDGRGRFIENSRKLYELRLWMRAAWLQLVSALGALKDEKLKTSGETYLFICLIIDHAFVCTRIYATCPRLAPKGQRDRKWSARENELNWDGSRRMISVGTSDTLSWWSRCIPKSFGTAGRRVLGSSSWHACFVEIWESHSELPLTQNTTSWAYRDGWISAVDRAIRVNLYFQEWELQKRCGGKLKEPSLVKAKPLKLPFRRLDEAFEQNQGSNFCSNQKCVPPNTPCRPGPGGLGIGRRSKPQLSARSNTFRSSFGNRKTSSCVVRSSLFSGSRLLTGFSSQYKLLCFVFPPVGLLIPAPRGLYQNKKIEERKVEREERTRSKRF